MPGVLLPSTTSLRASPFPFRFGHTRVSPSRRSRDREVPPFHGIPQTPPAEPDKAPTATGREAGFPAFCCHFRFPLTGGKTPAYNYDQVSRGLVMKVVSVIAVIVLVAVLCVLIAPAVDLGPAARLVRAVSLLICLVAFSPLVIPRQILLSPGWQRARIRIRLNESLPAIPILDLDCVLLC